MFAAISRVGRFPCRISGLLKRLRHDRRGISVVEFAISLPVFSMLAMYGIEIAHMATVNMQVSQLALSVADNASRLGQTDNSAVPPTIAESDIDAVMFGAMEQGRGIDFEENGRVILSSLQRDDATTKQYIHWQRCAGDLDRDSSYGNDSDNNGLTGATLAGMGRDTDRITASEDQAVMFAEVYYIYRPLFGSLFVDDDVTFKQEAAFIVRDDRQIDGTVDNPDALTGTKTSVC